MDERVNSVVGGEALEAADVVMFSDEAIERAAQKMFPTYWAGPFIGDLPSDYVSAGKDGCIAHIRAVIAALQGDGDE